MQGVFIVNLCGDLGDRDSSSNSGGRPKKNNGGRPKKNFEECCDRVKKYKIHELRDTYS